MLRNFYGYKDQFIPSNANYQRTTTAIGENPTGDKDEQKLREIIAID
jgi:hypothetical protein